MIVGRDTQNLTEEGVAKAAIETVAENTSDGVIAPMLYTALGGPVLGFLYKAANTMDSMVGYKNDRYLHFGRAAAKLYDVVNFFPARISALLMIVAAFLSGKSYNVRQAWRIWRRDSRKHASPNSAQTESVCAGALEIQLAGDASYFGKVVKKPCMFCCICCFLISFLEPVFFLELSFTDCQPPCYNHPQPAATQVRIPRHNSSQIHAVLLRI